jgi:hypothetical protein
VWVTFFVLFFFGMFEREISSYLALAAAAAVVSCG